ncbi:DUF6059 family protein [Kitasatospora aureofaciens]|uniref:DUF6059 family protein n=1 Tax=Kitasatospora aureofaciens TaxID=1894 RepID=UPI0037C593A5
MPCCPRHRSRLGCFLLTATQSLAMLWGLWAPPPPPDGSERGTAPLHPEQLRPDLPFTPAERALARQLRHPR